MRNGVFMPLNPRRRPQEKKNKTWDGDAYVSLMENKLLMISEEGKMYDHSILPSYFLYALTLELEWGPLLGKAIRFILGPNCS